MVDSRSYADLPDRPWVLVPVGSFEQHGPHLPLHTDTTIATAVADKAAERLGTAARPIVVAPPIAFGASGEHQAFPGTISMGLTALENVLVEVVRSASTWADRVIFVNGHGGNVAALTAAVRRLADERRRVGWVACAVAGGDAHAGHVETSIMLHLAADEVNMARAVVGNCAPLADLMPVMVSSGVAAVSPTGILGDPRGATAAAGAEFLATMVAGVGARILAERPDADGHLTRAHR